MTARLEQAGDRLIVWNGNTAKRGAVSPALYDTIQSAIQTAGQGPFRSVILTSEGDFFCAGGDLNAIRTRRALPEPERRAKVDLLHDVIRAIRASPVPVIAAVKGGAAGAGASLALACDLIVAEDGARFTAAYVKAGLVPDGGLTASLARLVPRALAMEMCLLGQPLSAERLAALGVITSAVPLADVLPAAHALADRLARGPRQAQGRIRQMVSAAYETSEAAQLDAERDAMAAAAAGAEAAEGIEAFLEKRTPRFE